jgi:hypothetical protein
MTLMRIWSETAAKMMQAGAAWSPPWMAAAAAPVAPPPPDVPRQLRAAMTEAWAQWWDQYLRSPQFLEMMKGSLEASTQGRKQFNEWLGSVHHQLQGVSRQDLDEVLSSLRRVEERLLAAIEAAAAEVRQLRAAVDRPPAQP